ncbi:hypothetical protein [Rhodococcus sp. NPDC058521]|uniref:hypothetical protein n=1 Tax=Rhodococcus sp. NPDC058521 TaxID=3346536 RepID=UPI0036478BAB
MDAEGREHLLHADVPAVEKALSGALNGLVAVYRDAQERMHPDTPAYKWCDTKVASLRDYANSAPGTRQWIIATIEMAEIETKLAASFVEQAASTYGFAVASPDPVRPDPDPEQPDPVPEAGRSEPVVRDSTFVVVTREEIETGDTDRVLALLNALTDTPEIARRAQGTVDLRFDGWDDEPDEPFEIDEIRDYVGKLDDRFPYWLFFGDTRTMSLQTVTQCFLPKFLTMDEQIEQIPRELNELLRSRWVPAMKYIAEFAGFTPDKVKSLYEAVLTYYTKIPAQLQD